MRMRADHRVIGIIEDHRLLRREVTEKCHVGDAGGPGHLLHGDIVKAPLSEKTNRMILKTSTGFLGSRHHTVLVTNTSGDAIPWCRSAEPDAWWRSSHSCFCWLILKACRAYGGIPPGRGCWVDGHDGMVRSPGRRGWGL